MNPSILGSLVSPISRRPLEFAAPDQLTDGEQVFPIVEGVPLLLPPGQFAEWYDEGLEVIFQEKSAETLARIAAPTGEEWAANLNLVLREDYGIDGIRNAFNRYAELSQEERMQSFVHVAPAERSAEHPLVQQRALDSRRKYAELTYSRKHVERLRRQVDEWAFHLPDFVAAVFEASPEIVVELGTGAGLGTYSLVKTGLPNAVLITSDVDYACAGNADGLAKVHGVEERVNGIAAGFWFLPFADNSIDVVCSHYGIDESRETGRVVDEVVRVLRPGGRFVAVCRSDPAYRLSMFLGQFDFGRQELGELARMANLFPGSEGLVRIARAKGLTAEKRLTMTPVSGHQRDLLVFRK